MTRKPCVPIIPRFGVRISSFIRASSFVLRHLISHSFVIRHSDFVIPTIALARRTVFDFILDMAQTQLTWYGQSGFKMITPAGSVLLIDPWLTNPVYDNGQEELSSLKRVDLILVSHGHSDHVGNAVEIGKRTHAKLVATFDLSAAMKNVLGYPAELAGNDTTGHFGGTLSLLDGEVAVTFVPAWHGTAIQKDDSSPPFYAGNPSGLIIAIRDGLTFYHTGDTDLFSDMSLVSRYNKIDVMLVCIGDHFTMDPRRAADAVMLVNPRTVIPIHYGTFPVLTGTPEVFDHELRKRTAKAELRVMKPGETLTLS
jgi:L-ascorbate metabolism protein UlaG (beta-lactamase superfamily)